MKQVYFLFAIVLGLSFNGNAQNTVEVDANATWVGFMNVFELDCTSFVFNSGWGVGDLQSVIDTGAGTVTLQPNFNAYRDNPTDPFWVNQSTLEGNKCMNASTYVENGALAGSPLTFVGSVPSYTLDPAYEAMAFIRVFNADFSVVKEETAPLVEGQTFEVIYTNVEAPDTHVQYGFVVTGPNANPDNEGALGSIVVGPESLGTTDFNVLSISAFPNPVTSTWNLKANANISNVTVFNILGQSVFQAQPNTLEAAINLSALKEGTYMAQITTDNGSQTMQIVKQ